MFNETLQYMRTKLTAVVSWLSPDGAPQAATVFFWVRDVGDDGFRILFVTRRHTRKFAGIERDPRIAMVIGTEFEPKTMQIEGTAKVIGTSDDVRSFLRDLDRLEVPPTQSILYANSFFQGKSRGHDFAILEMTPTWARYMNYDRDAHDASYHQIIGAPDQRTVPAAKTTKRSVRRRKR